MKSFDSRPPIQFEEEEKKLPKDEIEEICSDFELCMNFLVENYDDDNPNQDLEDLILELNQITKEGFAKIPKSFQDKLRVFI